MHICQGFSLTEVLLSLALMISASVALIQQQSHIIDYTQQIQWRNYALRQLDNASEQIIARNKPHKLNHFQLRQVRNKTQVTLNISWDKPLNSHLSRILIEK